MTCYLDTPQGSIVLRKLKANCYQFRYNDELLWKLIDERQKDALIKGVRLVFTRYSKRPKSLGSKNMIYKHIVKHGRTSDILYTIYEDKGEFCIHTGGKTACDLIESENISVIASELKANFLKRLVFLGHTYLLKHFPSEGEIVGINFVDYYQQGLMKFYDYVKNNCTQ